MTTIAIQGNAMHLPLPDECVDLVVTSPPYFGLRLYTDDGRPVPGQVGGESTPGEFIDALITATAEMVRVLKPSGSIFLNLGDRYAGSAPGRRDKESMQKLDQRLGRLGASALDRAGPVPIHRPSDGGLRAKSLMLLPERYRIAAIDRLGLIARAVIVWDKPNGLPESVCDRVRRSHEDWVHLVKQPRYFSAVDEIREKHSEESKRIEARAAKKPGGYTPLHRAEGAMPFAGGTSQTGRPLHPLGKLPGSVWRISASPLTLPGELGVDHFAAFPPEWPKRIIQGWSPAGVCVECGEGRRPVVAKDRRKQGLTLHSGWTDGASGGMHGDDFVTRGETTATITGYACACPEPTAATRPAVVLDPFGGTGTTAMVAHALGRVGISVDLSHDYCRVAQWRTHDRAQIAKVRDEIFRKPVPQSEDQTSLFTFDAVAQGGKQ